MRPGVDFAQGLDRHFRINLRGVEPRVSEYLLDQADVCAVLKHVRDAVVAEQMATSALADVDRFDRFCYPVADIGRTHALSVAAKKKGLFARIDDSLRTGSVKVSFDLARLFKIHRLYKSPFSVPTTTCWSNWAIFTARYGLLSLVVVGPPEISYPTHNSVKTCAKIRLEFGRLHRGSERRIRIGKIYFKRLTPFFFSKKNKGKRKVKNVVKAP